MLRLRSSEGTQGSSSSSPPGSSFHPLCPQEYSDYKKEPNTFILCCWELLVAPLPGLSKTEKPRDSQPAEPPALQAQRSCFGVSANSRAAHFRISTFLTCPKPLQQGCTRLCSCSRHSWNAGAAVPHWKGRMEQLQHLLQMFRDHSELGELELPPGTAPGRTPCPGAVGSSGAAQGSGKPRCCPS